MLSSLQSGNSLGWINSDLNWLWLTWNDNLNSEFEIVNLNELIILDVGIINNLLVISDSSTIDSEFIIGVRQFIVINKNIFEILNLVSRVHLERELTLERILEFDVDVLPHECDL